MAFKAKLTCFVLLTIILRTVRFCFRSVHRSTDIADFSVTNKEEFCCDSLTQLPGAPMIENRA